MNEPPTWSEMFPDGRTIFYEGDDPAGFVAAIKAEFGLDPSDDPNWGTYIAWGAARPAGEPEGFTSYSFHCPVQHLDAIYGGDRWPMGS